MSWARSRPNGQAAAGKYKTPEHRALRRDLLAAFTPGDPCAFCGTPMWGPAAAIHLGHQDDGVRYRGLEHAACNVRDGARRGRARQDVTRLQW